MACVSEFNPTSPTSVKRFLRDESFHPSKRLGQSFLMDQGTASRIVSVSGLKQDQSCLEIGPGLGALTAALSSVAVSLTAVEVDGRLVEVLRRQYTGNERVHIVHADFLKVDLPALLESIDAPVQIVANIPYSITTPIIEKLLAHKRRLAGITLLVQKEVALRITAQPGASSYSSLSVFCSYHCDASIAFNVSRHLFVPVPDVDSAVLTLTPKEQALSEEEERWFFRVLRAAFGQRRKTLLNTLSHGLDMPRGETTLLISEAGISPGSRAEELSVGDYEALARTALQRSLR